MEVVQVAEHEQDRLLSRKIGQQPHDRGNEVELVAARAVRERPAPTAGPE